MICAFSSCGGWCGGFVWNVIDVFSKIVLKLYLKQSYLVCVEK